MENHASLNGIRGVALFEATKGGVVLLAGFGLLALIHHDAQAVVDQLVTRLHLNPAKGYPHVFVDFARQLTDARLGMLALLALSYAVARFVEAYGLWHQRAWAEWLAVVSGGIYLFAEIYELARGVTALKVVALIINLAVVAYLAFALYRSKRLVW
ncbi:MAG TPA: DUF2127 domain-containing protein [Clostridia bacterium]|nr:DUF2127 domain-containing protein [Clostridia bacterium]